MLCRSRGLTHITYRLLPRLLWTSHPLSLGLPRPTMKTRPLSHSVSSAHTFSTMRLGGREQHIRDLSLFAILDDE